MDLQVNNIYIYMKSGGHDQSRLLTSGHMV